MTALKIVFLKKFSYHKQTFLANLNPRAALYEENGRGIEVGLQLYQLNNSFIFDLCKIPDVTGKD